MSPGGKGDLCVGLTTFPPLCAYCLEILGASTSWSPKGSKMLNNPNLCWKIAAKILRNSIFHIYIRIRVLFPFPLRTSSVLGEESFNSFLEFVYITFYVFVRFCSYGTEKLNEKDERSRIFTSTLAAKLP